MRRKISILRKLVRSAIVITPIIYFLASSHDATAQIVPISQERYVKIYDVGGLEVQAAPDFGPFTAFISANENGTYAGYVDQESTITDTAIAASGGILDAITIPAESSFDLTFLLTAPVTAQYFEGEGDGRTPVDAQVHLISASDPTRMLVTSQLVYNFYNPLDGLTYQQGRSQTLSLPAGVYTLEANVIPNGLPSPWTGGYSTNLSVLPISSGGPNLPTALSSAGNSISLGTNQIGGIGAGVMSVGGGDVTLPQVTAVGVFTSLYFNVNSYEQLQNQLSVAPPPGVNVYLSPGQTTQLWDLHSTGVFTGSATVTLHYDPTLIGGVDPSQLQIYHYTSGVWVAVANEIIDPVADTITFTTDSFSPFVLGVAVPEPGSIVIALGAMVSAGAVRFARRLGPRRSVNV